MQIETPPADKPNDKAEGERQASSCVTLSRWVFQGMSGMAYLAREGALT